MEEFSFHSLENLPIILLSMLGFRSIESLNDLILQSKMKNTKRILKQQL